MKTIKVIDLLNKIANGEDMPLKIIFNNMVYIFEKEIGDYENENVDYLFEEITNYTDTKNFLNAKVEIIEEEKHIAKINKSYPIFNFDEKSFLAMKDMLQDVYSKQVEIIKAVNELKEEGK